MAQRQAQQLCSEATLDDAAACDDGGSALRAFAMASNAFEPAKDEQFAPLGHAVQLGTIGHQPLRRVSELASGLTRNQVPRNRLGVRVPCPPLDASVNCVILCVKSVADDFEDTLV